jgi:hypothetical protein
LARILPIKKVSTKRLTAPRSTKRNSERKEVKKDGRRKSDRILQSG